MEKINFIVVCTEKYSAEYANKTLNMFKRNYQGTFDAFCITDKREEISQEYTCIDKDKALIGWWNKLSIFGQELPHEYTLYADLDLLFLNDITDVIRFTMERIQDFQIACFGDHIGWHGEKFGSAFMFFNQEKMRWLFSEFSKDLESNQGTVGGDQIWLGKRLSEVMYLEEYFQNFVRSLKFDVASISNDKKSIQIPSNIENDFLLLNCHGQPKPHELRELGWKPIESIWI